MSTTSDEIIVINTSSTSRIDYFVDYGNFVEFNKPGKITTTGDHEITKPNNTKAVINMISGRNVGGSDNVIKLYRKYPSEKYEIFRAEPLEPGEGFIYNGIDVKVYAIDGSIKVTHAVGGGGGGTVDEVVAGEGILVDDSDPTAPIVSLDTALVIALIEGIG